MKFSILVTLFLIIGLADNCSQRAADENSARNDMIFKSYDFPTHPNLTYLCNQRVYGAGREITWDAFASSSAPSELVSYYRQKLGAAGFERTGEGGVWRVPPDNGPPKRVLDIMAAETDSPARRCEKAPPPDARTIIMLSRMN
jgi:hypothetical protein